jgi:hypothetical protein
VLAHPIFDAVLGFYTVSGAALVRYLWNCRTPMVASVRRLQVPKLDPYAVWSLSSGSDVGPV